MFLLNESYWNVLKWPLLEPTERIVDRQKVQLHITKHGGGMMMLVIVLVKTKNYGRS